MKKVKGAIIILVLLSLGMMINPFWSFPPQVSLSQVDMVAQSMESVVTVHISSYDGHIGSGFYIGNRTIVTAGHMLKDEIEKVIFEDEIECLVLEQIVHPDYDVGVLIINDPNKPALKFDPAEVQRGEVIFILGNPGKETFISTKGIVCGRTTWDVWFGESLLIITDATAWAGSSGSVVLDIDGEIRGVHVGRLKGRGDYSLGVCTKDILKAIKAAGLEID